MAFTPINANPEKTYRCFSISYNFFNFLYCYLYLFLLTLSSRQTASSNSFWIFASYAKNEESIFVQFRFILISLLIRIIIWKFLCYFDMLFKSVVRKIEEYIHPILICSYFSYICVPKPVGPVYLSRLERVKVYYFYRIQ